MNLEKIKKLEREKGVEISPLLQQATSMKDIDSLRAVKKLMNKCRSSDMKAVVLDALPRSPLIEFAARIKDYSRVQIAASLLWLYPQYPQEVNEFLSWLHLPPVQDYYELKNFMQGWIVEDN
jgi:hypothetical protein